MKPKVVSLFSGAGGLDLGFEAAGFEVAAAVELDSDCCATLRQNTGWSVIQKDTSKLTGNELLDTTGLGPGDVDLLMGGPPCQPFSKASYWTRGDSRRLSDPRANTLLDYMRFVEELQPKVFLLENVHGITYTGKEEGFQLLHRKARSINRRTGTKYVLAWAVLDTADFGVPQHRSRFFLVGHREGTLFRFPTPTHGAPLDDDPHQLRLVEPPIRPYATAWDAIGSLVPRGDEALAPKGYWKDLLPSIPEGKNYLWHTDHGGGKVLFGWRTRYWSFLLKLAKNLPSWTIPAQPGPAIGPFHWANRYLSEGELAALQTFPRGTQFTGGRNSIQRQIGNAVPSLMGEVLGRSISSAFFDGRPHREPSLIIHPRRTTPPPEEVLPVPSTYLHLVGDHAPHPGTRRGPGARARGLQPRLGI